MKIKFVTKDILENAGINKEILEVLTEGIRYPIINHMIHNDHMIRCQIVYDEKGNKFKYDMPIKVFNDLPFVEK